MDEASGRQQWQPVSGSRSGSRGRNGSTYPGEAPQSIYQEETPLDKIDP
jgi:hypothetical protein